MITLPLIAVSWFMTLGYVPQHTVEYSWMKYEPQHTATYTELGLEATILSRLRVKTSIETYQYWLGKGVSFYPFRADYSIQAELDLHKTLTLGVKHKCVHPVVYSKRNVYPLATAETMVYATLRGE